jgi:hypothetical protein
MKKTTNQPAGQNISRRHIIGAAAAASALLFRVRYHVDPRSRWRR